MEARIRELAKDSSNVRWRAVSHDTHVASRMEQRDIDDHMMFEVLRGGYLEGPIEAGKNPGEWQCRMVKRMKGRRELGVATVLINNSKLFIKTVRWEDLS
jgi:hypothetical protein